MTPWAQILREIRKEQGLSQRRLVELAGVNRSTYRAIEAGRVPMRMGDLEKVLDALGYELEIHAKAPQRD